MEVKGVKIHYVVWDHAGNSDKKKADNKTSTCLNNSLPFVTLRKSYVVLLLFDITDKDSFKDIDCWLLRARDYVSAYTDFALVGTKADL